MRDIGAGRSERHRSRQRLETQGQTEVRDTGQAQVRDTGAEEVRDTGAGRGESHRSR